MGTFLYFGSECSTIKGGQMIPGEHVDSIVFAGEGEVTIRTKGSANVQAKSHRFKLEGNCPAVRLLKLAGKMEGHHIYLSSSEFTGVNELDVLTPEGRPYLIANLKTGSVTTGTREAVLDVAKYLNRQPEMQKGVLR